MAFLNPGQTPVLATDQPLYELAKQIQWQWPDYGQDKFVILFGGLHIELASLRSIWTLLQDNGWTSAICEPNVAPSGTAEYFLTASSITRTRQAHHITACNLMKKAYQDYCTDKPGRPPLGLEDWCGQRRRASPQFQFWNQVVDVELAIIYSFPFYQRRKQKYVEGVLDQTTAHRVKLPVTDQMFVQERLHQKVQMHLF